MLVAVDVHYKEDYAKTVLLLFEEWTSEDYTGIIEIKSTDIAEYIPGEFYKRELPCILEGLKKIDTAAIDLIIIDGYVFVDDDRNWGLGAHLYHALQKKIPIVGVAKTRFANNTDTVVQVCRGKSGKPLFVSAIGMDVEDAARQLLMMQGNYRLPHLLKVIDQKTKEG